MPIWYDQLVLVKARGKGRYAGAMTSTLPVAPLRSFEVVARQTASIVQASYRIGQRLPPERELAKTFGVSRPTIREAIQRSEERRVGKECRSRWSPYH